MTYLLFLTAISLSVIAAWYAISGLVAIFAASVVPIMIMGSLLEASKLVVASWLYRYWNAIPKLMKGYFTIALVILMMLTSMGIFGFLSKAHLDQAVPTGDVAAKIEIIDDKIKIQQDIIAQYRKDLEQLNDQIDKYTEVGSVTRGVKVREQQKVERETIMKKIEEGQSQITKLREERSPISAELRKVEAEVGPLKYIAAVIYGDELNDNLLESAVRIVIIMIVMVFDPLAVLMLIAANWSLRNDENNNVVRGLPELPETKKGTETTTSSEETVAPETKPEPEPTVKEIRIEDTVETNSIVSMEKDEPEIVLEDDWDQTHYDREQSRNRKVGRLLSEIDTKKATRTSSFLNKVESQIEKAPGINTIEVDVDELQHPAPFIIKDDKN